MNDGYRGVEFLGSLPIEDVGWKVRIYLIRGDTSEVIDRDDLSERLSAKIRAVESGHLSSEFAYTRTGFVLAHYGRRGVTYSIWHWADWNGTWECFCQAWYCYGRALDEMVALDRTEPIFCHHELELVAAEA